MVVLLLFLSILPVFLLGRYVYKTDFEKEPTDLLVGWFLMGVGSVAITAILTDYLEELVPFFAAENQMKLDVVSLIPYIFIGVALIEEFSKWIFVYKYGYNHYEFNHAYDAIVYATFVSLGFACIENILYVFSYGIETALVRAITAVPGHTCFGVLMGFFMGLAKTADKCRNKQLARKNKIRSILCPVLAHGIYDFLIFGSSHLSCLMFIFICFIYFLFTTSMDMVRQLSAIHYDIRGYSIN